MRPPVSLQAFRPALRSLVRSRSFAITAVLTLGLGMGAVTAIYTLLERVVLDPLPYPQPDRLVRLKNPVPAVGAGTQWELSAAQYFYFGAHVPSLAALGLYQRSVGILTAADAQSAQRVETATVTASIFDLLGARAIRGRLIDRRDDVPGAPSVAVLSDEFWRRQFGGAPDVVGRTIRVNDRPVEVIGILARGVELPPEPEQGIGAASDIWMPQQLDPAGPFYNNHVYPAVARLAPGATVAGAQAELARLTPQLVETFPQAYTAPFFASTGFHTTLTPLRRYIVGAAAGHLWILFGAVAAVFAIACANVINLLLVRLEARRRELAVRLALGAGRRNLAADALREGLLLALGGAILGLLLGWLGTRALVALAPPNVPRLANVHLDAGVLAFLAAVTVVVALALALVPAARAGVAPATVLGDGGRTTTVGRERQRLRGTLVVVQVALALVLVVGAGLLLRSFERLRHADSGMDPRGVLSVDLYLPPHRYDSAYKAWRFYGEAAARIRAIAGVRAVGMGTAIPLSGGYGCTAQGFEDHAVYQRIADAGTTTCAGQQTIAPGYFAALGIPIVEGRDLSPADNDNPTRGAVVVSRAFAHRFWGDADPIGQGIGPLGWGKPPFYHVVGVVGDVRAESMDGPLAIAVYYPVVGIPGVRSGGVANPMTLLVRVAPDRDPMSYLGAVRRTVASIDPLVPLANAEDVESVVARSMSQVTFTMTLLAIAGLAALALAAVGLFGVISYVVTRRTNELGVRLALGAQPAQLERMVVGSALRLTAIGLVIGALGGLAVGRLLRGLLSGVPPWDPAALGGSLLVLAAVAAAAAWLPARRAAAVDPTIALRQD